MQSPRIAFFPDSFHEVNGVAHTSRQFAAFAERQAIPMLVVRAAPAGQIVPALPSTSGSVESLDLRRSQVAVPMERDLHFDPLFLRFSGIVERTLRAWKPDVIHITGPSELGIMGAYFAWKLRLPLAASWHTNVHEYAARRLGGIAAGLGLGPAATAGLSGRVEALTLAATGRFYRLAHVLYAPNPALCRLLEEHTGRACYLMARGVDATIFSPQRRSRTAESTLPRLGYVGRLSVEKNVRLLPQIAAQLMASGVHAQWIIVGHGSEEAALRRAMPAGTIFAGVLRGAELAAAYADMDLFIFPSHTDTFGNVVLEALASGVPAVVTPDGGPATIVENGRTGSIASDDAFASAVEALLRDRGRLEGMKHAARDAALGYTWDRIFETVIAAYPRTREALRPETGAWHSTSM